MGTKQVHFLLVAAVFAAGCAATGERTAGGSKRTAAENEVAQRTGELIDFVMNEDYEAVRAMAHPAQAAGFDARQFVQDRFRLKLGTFQIVVVDKKSIGATETKDRKFMLSSTVAYVRIMATNEVLPVYVNLYWQKQGATWYIVPFPEV